MKKKKKYSHKIIFLYLFFFIAGFFVYHYYYKLYIYKPKLVVYTIDYTNKSKQLVALVDKELNKFIYPRDIKEQKTQFFEEKNSKNSIKWVKTYKKVVVPISLKRKYKENLLEAIKKINGKLIDYNEKEKNIIINLGFDNIITYSLILEKVPSIAIIVDDFGYKKEIINLFLKMNYSLTFSILPSEIYSLYASKKAKDLGIETMLHLPMESVKPNQNPGKYAIMSNMDEKGIRELVRKNINAVPNIKGVNNHMGSKITADEKIMRIVLEEIKKKDLYFIDSRTTKDTKAQKIATELGVRTNKNYLFLDNEMSVEYIKDRIKKLISICLKNGESIGICHPHYNTVLAIQESFPLFESSGVRLVYASQLTK